MTRLPVSPGISGIPTGTIPTDPSAFVEWFKNSYLPRWAANADVRNAIPGTGVQISGDLSSPGFVGFEEIAGNSVLGNPTGAPGDVQAITASADGLFLQRASGSLVFGSVAVVSTNSITGIGSAASPLKLVNDLVSPGTSQVYGTSAAGVRGWFPASTGNITADTHSGIPTGVGLGPNDEFEIGATIDIGGTRYSGATAWTAFNLGTGSTAISEGSLVFAPQVGSGVNYSGYTQPVPSTGNWTYVMKVSAAQVTSNQLIGMLLATVAGPSGHLYLFGISLNSVTAQRATNSSTFSSNPAVGVIQGFIGTAGSTAGSTIYFYLQISWDSGTNTVTMSVSGSGIPGTFSVIISEPAATFLGTPAFIGVGAENQATANALAVVDWFRRTA